MAAIFQTNDIKGAFPDDRYIIPADIIPEALALNDSVVTPTSAVQGDAPRLNIPYISQAPEANIVAEGAEIAASEATVNQISFGTHKLALIADLTNESLAYADAANAVNNSAMSALTAKADWLLMNAPVDSTGTLPTGLANMAAASDSTDGVSEVKPSSMAKALTGVLECLAKVTDAGGDPTAIVMRYSTWAKLLGVEDSSGRPMIQPDVTSAAAPVLFNVPVIFNRAVPQGTVMVMSAKDVITSVSQIEAAMSDQPKFTSMRTLLRLSMRLGYGTVYPQRIGRVVLPAK